MIHQFPSPHGRSGNEPKKIVVHSMGEYICDPDPLHASKFLENYKLSAHILVGSNGDLWRLRNDYDIAWHARGHNTNSLGIEFLVEGEHTYGTFIDAIREPGWVTAEQWTAGIVVIKDWCNHFNIPITSVHRHSDLSPGRKVDPGAGFNWDNLLSEISSGNT